MQTLGAERVSTIVPYYQRPLAIGLTFGAVLVIALPLVWARMSPNDSGVLPYLILAEGVGLGTTHFFLTLAIYLQPSQLEYANSSWGRRLIYFALPALILLTFAFLEAWPLRTAAPVAATYFYLAVRFADFFHVGRQHVGVLQIWKTPLKGSLPSWTRHAENALFVGLAVLQLQTYAFGGFFPSDRMSAWLPALLLGGLFLMIVVQYLVPLSARETRKAGVLALGYLCAQALCAALAVYATWLYLTVLALHYLEYHLLMAPRCFGETAGPRTGVLGFFRRGAVFYALMLVVVALFEARTFVVTESLALRYVVHIFDGIFVLHYVLDAFLWKFGNPYYRAQLYPLYFQPRLKPSPVGAGQTSRAAFKVAGAVAAVALLAAVVPPVRNGLSGFAQHFQTRVIDPLHAEEYMRWGIHEAQTGRFNDAAHHLTRAGQLAPEDQRIKGWLRMLSQAQQTQPKQP
jgi:hypothetical protein